MNVLFTSQKVLNLLPAAVVLTGANRPDEALDGPWDLPCPARPLLRRRIAIQKDGQPCDSDGLQPEPDRLSMAVQLARDRRDRESLRRQLCGYDDASSCIHVQSLLWTVGFLRQQCEYWRRPSYCKYLADSHVTSEGVISVWLGQVIQYISEQSMIWLIER